VIVITAFIAVVALRAATVQSLTTLLPKYFADLGYTSGTYGVMIGVFAFAGALGTFLGGYLGDRVNRRLTLFASTLLSVPFCFLLLRVDGWLFYLAAACAGALLNVPHSILIIMAQRLLPKREGMIGGAVLGFMFASGAALAWLASWFADQVGLLTVLSLLAFVPIGAAFSALLLPSTRQIEQPVPPTGAPAAAD
jgi:FSR family fosmidomycin resistance protein-like MFS transporter